MIYRFTRRRLAPSSLATRHAPRTTRTGFTLVEMLVAMGLTMFIMVILSQAFATGLDVFTQLKAVGDMEENLRAAATALRNDLAADHFDGKRRLSDPDLYTNPPREGFFRIFRAAVPTVEGVDAYGLQSKRSAVCVLHMMVKRRGNQRPDFFSAAVPATSPLLSPPDKTTFFGQFADARLQETPAAGSTLGAYTSQWAEVAYFVVQTGTTVQPNDRTSTVGMPLYALYRVERLVVPDNTYLNWANGLAGAPITVTPATTAAYAQLSWRPVTAGANQTMYFNTASDLAVRANRSFYFNNTVGNLTVSPAGFTLDTTTAAGKANVLTPAGRGAALVIGNVVSFEVDVVRAQAPLSPGGSRQYEKTQEGYFSGYGYASANFDSATTTSPWFIMGVGVSLRVWDQKTQQARQITVMQDM